MFANLFLKEEEETALKTTRREKARADADYMRQVMCFVEMLNYPLLLYQHSLTFLDAVSFNFRS